jgi:signal transduction histidine kinase
MTGSPRQLGQVVLNLLVNGLQAISEHGQVRVAARSLGDELEVVVSDDGDGMSEETKARLFEPFFTTKTRHGLGIGLSVVRDIVTAQGGTIEVKSALGSGSEFRIVLPRQPRRTG